MKVFFWDFQDDNDIVRQWLMFVSNILVFAFTAFALVRTWRYYRECMFQMMPLSINLIATFILLMLKLFEKGYEFDYIGHLIEIFTYFLFCYTFAIMYSLISDATQRRRVRIIWNTLLGIMIVLLIMFSVFVFTGLISKTCKKTHEQQPAIYALVFQFLSFAPTAYFGVKILMKMARKEQATQPDEDSTASSFSSQIYIKQRRKQITMVLLTYFISLLIRLITTVLTIFMWKKLFSCERIDNSSIITSDHVEGQVILVFQSINELLPHVVIPIAMYVIPLRKIDRSKSITLNQAFLDEEDHDDHFHRDDHVHVKVSSLLSSRISEDSTPKFRSKIKTRNGLDEQQGS